MFFSSSIDQVLATLVIAVVYLALLRLMDLNEREPVWCLLLAFVLGGAAAGALYLALDPVTLTLGTWRGAAVTQLALFVALGIVFQIFTAVARLRGWSDVSDVVDGVLYGAAAGLGFTCGEQIATLPSDTMVAMMPTSLWSTMVTAGVAGLANGVFAAFTGAGFAVAATRRTPLGRLTPLLGLAAAIVVHGTYDMLAYGNALGGAEALWRARAALALPVLAMAAVMVRGLIAERRAIVAELQDEVAAQVMPATDLWLLGRFTRRQTVYLAGLLAGRFGEVQALAAVHNRQVMLALAKRRMKQAVGRERRIAEAEADALRDSLRQTRERLSATRETNPRGGQP